MTTRFPACLLLTLAFLLLTLAFTQALVPAGQGTAPDDQPGDPPATRVLDHGGSFRPTSLGGRDRILLSLAFSPDGQTLASAGGGAAEREGPAEGEMKLWDVATGKALRTLAVDGQIVFHVSFSPNGKLLAAACGSGTAVPVVPGEIRLWNSVNGELVRTLPSHHRGAYVTAFSADGKHLASGGIATIDEDRKVEVRGANAAGEIRLWEIKSGQELWRRGGHTGAVGSIAFSADGKTLASSGGLADGQVKLWDVDAGTELGTLRLEAEAIGPIAFGPQANALVVLGFGLAGKDDRHPFTAQVSRWDLLEKRQVQAAHITNGNAYRLALSHRGDLLASACHDGVTVYDVAKEALVRSFRSKFRMRPIAFSPNDELLAAGSDDGTVTLWSVAKVRK